METTGMGWEGLPVFWMVIVVIYGIVRYTIDRYERRQYLKTDMDETAYLYALARKRGCSEFDIFTESTGNWQVPPRQVELDFNDYLQTGRLPYYVRDYIRRSKDQVGQWPRQFPPGGQLPPSWSA